MSMCIGGDQDIPGSNKSGDVRRWCQRSLESAYLYEKGYELGIKTSQVSLDCN